MQVQLPQGVEGLKGCEGIELDFAEGIEGGVGDEFCEESELVIGAGSDAGGVRTLGGTAGRDAGQRGTGLCGHGVRDGEGGEDGASASNDIGRDASEFGDMDAVGLIGLAGEDAVDKDDLGLISLAPFADGDVEVFDAAGERFVGAGFEVGEFVIVGGKERAGAADSEVFGDGPGE